MKKYLALLLLGGILTLTSQATTFAQDDPDAMAQKYNIQFPIAELGNCTSFAFCKAYCDDASHQETCIAFAKKKGFYQEVQRPQENTSLLQAAQTELGCRSESSCREVCEQEANITKCQAFAQKHNLGGGPQGRNPSDRQILEKAKTILGCDSESSCRAVCENPANQEKCSEFAKQAGLSGGIQRVGPGGCNSEESCMTYCQSHPEACGIQGNNSGGSQEKEKFCRENPEKCSGGSMGPAMNPDEYCRQNPDKCQPPTGAYQQYNESYQRPSGYQEYQSQEYRQPENQYQPSQQYQQYPPENYSQEQRDETYTQEQSVQGATTVSLWQRILNFFWNR